MSSLTDRRARSNGTAGDAVDLREALCNEGLVGQACSIQVPTERITLLNGLVLDIDPSVLAPDNPLFPPANDPRKFLEGIEPVLDRHLVFRDAEVRSSGRGLHAVVKFDPPVELASSADQRRWATLVRAVQGSLPADPNAPGITALTRPVGSINSKNGARVEVLRPGRPVDPARVEAFVREMATAPFRAVAMVLWDRSGSSPARSAASPVRRSACRTAAGRATDAARSPWIGSTRPPIGPTAAMPEVRAGATRNRPRFGTMPSRGRSPFTGQANRGTRSRPAAGGRRRNPGRVGPAEPAPPAAFPIAPLKDEHLDMAKSISLAAMQAGKLYDSLRGYRIGAVVGDRERAVIHGVTDKGVLVDGKTVDGFLAEAGGILADSKRVYIYGNTTVFESWRSEGGSLSPLAVAGRAEPQASYLLANLFVTGFETKTGTAQSLAAPKLVQALLADDSLGRSLPTIRYHARRPTFDPNFVLCNPGWNPGPGILVHGPEIVPAPWDPGDVPATLAIDHLPPHLRALLREFDWRSDADLANTVAMLLTGLLVNQFLDDPHPAGIVDGNQSELGKTLLVHCLGKVLDGITLEPIRLGNDDEVEKKLCAQVRSSDSSLFFFDNVRARIESTVLEQNILSPAVTFRILGKSDTVQRPNAFLWMITSNQTAGTPDFISRGVPIRLYYEGNPKARVFEGDPLAYAAGHRQEILGELAGMVVRWVEHGRPAGSQAHRCRHWAATIGGILDVAGLGGPFLANVAEAEAAMDQGLVDLATLAEHVVVRGMADLHVAAGGDIASKGGTAGRWAEVFEATGVLREKLAECSSPKARETHIGTFLGGKVDRTVPIEADEGPRLATLRKQEGRSRKRHYLFEVGMAGGGPGPEPSSRRENVPPSIDPAKDAGDKGPPVVNFGPDEGDPQDEPTWL